MRKREEEHELQVLQMLGNMFTQAVGQLNQGGQIAMQAPPFPQVFDANRQFYQGNFDSLHYNPNEKSEDATLNYHEVSNALF